MKLVDRHPEFLSSGGEGVFQRTDRLCAVCNGEGSRLGCDACHDSGREYEPAPLRTGVGVQFDCPCGAPDCPPVYVPFLNPLDGGPALEPRGWQREGDTFDTLTLTPSILRRHDLGGCGWHGFVTRGEVLTC